MDRKLQRHRADSLRQHGFLVLHVTETSVLSSSSIFRPKSFSVALRRQKSINQSINLPILISPISNFDNQHIWGVHLGPHLGEGQVVWIACKGKGTERAYGPLGEGKGEGEGRRRIGGREGLGKREGILGELRLGWMGLGEIGGHPLNRLPTAPH